MQEQTTRRRWPAPTIDKGDTMPHDLVEMYLQPALTTLRLELRDFSYAGLVQLAEDLRRGAVARGTWAGCVLSYKHGARGSAREDRLGRQRNPFTVAWDKRWITDAEVRAEVLAEIERRRRAVALPERLAGLFARVRRHAARN